MLSLFYEGRISCFSPVTYLDRADITLIRPLLYVPEHYVRSFAKRHELPIVHNPCPADGNTKRQEIKDLLKSLEKTMPGVRERIFGAMQRYPLEGWEPDKTRDVYKRQFLRGLLLDLYIRRFVSPPAKANILTIPPGLHGGAGTLSGGPGALPGGGAAVFHIQGPGPGNCGE